MKKVNIKWWSDWLDGDMIDRLDMTKNLPILKELRSMAKNDKLTDEMFYHSFNTILNSLFEDLAEECYLRYKK